MFTVSVEVGGTLHPIKFGATYHDRAMQHDLARGLSAGVGRPGIVPGPFETADGPMYDGVTAIVVTDAAGSVVHRFVDTVDVAGAEMLWRHKDGLVWFRGGN